MKLVLFIKPKKISRNAGDFCLEAKGFKQYTF